MFAIINGGFIYYPALLHDPTKIQQGIS